MARTQTRVRPHLELDPRVTPAAQRLAEAVLQAISNGSLVDGDRMPSTRLMASDVQMPRSSVVDAYEALCGIGILIAEQGSGTRVAEGARLLLADQPHPQQQPPTTGGDNETSRLDLTVPGCSSEQVLDLRDWNRAWREATRPGSHEESHDELRLQVAAHLRSFRGITQGSDRLLLRPSMGAAIIDLVHALGLRGGSVAVESPGNPRVQRQFISAGCRLHSIGVDDDGMRTGALRPDDLAVHVTPARQWPTGVRLSAARREQLFEWSLQTGGTILEDDQDADFSYGQAPEPTLYATAPDGVRVIYIGSSWKLVAPDLHVVWMLVDPSLKALPRDVAPISAYAARALATYMATGALYRHRNRALRLFEERRTALIQHLESSVPGVTVKGAASGTELLLELPDNCDELRVQREVERAGFQVSTLGDFTKGRHQPCLLVEFSQLPPLMAQRFAGVLGSAIDYLSSGDIARERH